MRSTVEVIIYFYLFICVSLLLFNVFYIFRSKLHEKGRKSRIEAWRKELRGQSPDAVLTERQLQSLRKIDHLTAYHAVLTENVLDQGAGAQYFRKNTLQLQRLAADYQKKPAMERAFMAYVIASFHTPDVGNNDMLAEIMLSYLENSTVFCRENVLQALYALGHSQAVEHAFDIFHERGWYHSPKLIADGMARFTGDREELALRLFRFRNSWEDHLVLAVVQFASGLRSEKIEAAFSSAFLTEQLSDEVRFSLIRYFQKHVRDEVKDRLIQIVDTEEGAERPFAVPAASALQYYPSEETKAALLQALRSRNWYVRRNAAMSLLAIGLTEEDEESVRESGDRYAYEMLEYAKERANKNVRKEATA